METRICQRCNTEKLLEDFARYKKGQDKRRPFCKKCHAANERSYRSQRREILGEDHPLLLPLPRPSRLPTQEPDERTCRVCHVTKPITAFAWATKERRRHKNICPDCINISQRAQRDRRRLAAMKPRRCPVCDTVKPADDFHWRVKSQFLRQRLCKECAAQYGASYKEAQRTLLGEEGMTAFYKAEYQKTRDKQLEYHKNYYQETQEHQKAKSRAWYAENRSHAIAQARIRRLRTYFGLTPDEYEAMLVAQNNVCAICGQNGKKLHIDHCHTTGKIRGLLCAPCNSFLGRIHDSPAVLDQIKRYLLQGVETVPSSA